MTAASRSSRQATIFALRDILMKLGFVTATGLASLGEAVIGAQTTMVVLTAAWFALSLPALSQRRIHKVGSGTKL